MIDGLDGTAGGVSIVALLSLAYAALVQGLGTQAALLLLLAAAVTGFLMWNMRFPGVRTQARVFMGDSGSMMLGLALCWFSIDLTQGEGRTLPPIVCMWILAVPLLDMARVMFVRMRKRISVFEADREHLHYLLLERGVPVYRATWIMTGSAALASVLGLGAWHLGVPDWAISYAFIALFVLVLVTAYFRESAIAREAASAPVTPDWTPHDRLIRARERRERRERDGRGADAP
jgi:UDP-GlcNAc:undecaprenyl-phosphate GlcNAc-1-phosphate transferase